MNRICTTLYAAIVLTAGGTWSGSGADDVRCRMTRRKEGSARPRASITDFTPAVWQWSRLSNGFVESGRTAASCLQRWSCTSRQSAFCITSAELIPRCGVGTRNSGRSILSHPGSRPRRRASCSIGSPSSGGRSLITRLDQYDVSTCFALFALPGVPVAGKALSCPPSGADPGPGLRLGMSPVLSGVSLRRETTALYHGSCPVAFLNFDTVDEEMVQASANLAASVALPAKILCSGFPESLSLLDHSWSAVQSSESTACKLPSPWCA
mmetsp:Transcript_51594/g.122896  ORF Transcript_51594/g.122896 Transcript_51594/m.122896 type:complete len:267 (+) Transcript_51594:856-1656(+)